MDVIMIKLLVLLNGQGLITKIEEVGSEIGEPDCKLTNPYVYMADGTLQPWLSEFTNQNVFMIHSDKIITITDPKPSLLEKYEQLTK
jgi:hypothetical protein